MKFRWIKTNLSPIQKICLAALFMSLTVILQKVVAINYIPVIPFVRLSFGGPALIMFSSILLGPIYGAFVGLGSDLLGYLIFDPRTYPPYLQITAIYTLLGFVSYFVFSFVANIKNRKLMFIIEGVSFAAIWLAISLFVILNNQVTLFSSTYDIPLLCKILVPSIAGLIFIGLMLFSILYKGKDDNPLISPLHICFASFICDLFVLVLFGSVMKAWAFGFATYLVILLCQAIVLFFNVMLDTIFISTFERFTKKFFKQETI